MNTYASERQAARQSKRCPHCHGSAAHVACVKCGRDMCEDCISIAPSVGKVCGLCLDRMNDKDE